MAREPLVEERVLRVEKLQDAAVLPHDALEEPLGLLAHRHAQVLIEVGKLLDVRLDVLERAELQPLSAELPHQRRGPRVLQHAPHLGRQHVRRPQRPGVGLRLRSARSGMLAHRKYDSRVASSCWLDGAHGRRRRRVILLEAKQEVGRHQQRLQRDRDAVVKRLAALPRLAEERRVAGHLGAGHWTPKRALGQRRRRCAWRSRRRGCRADDRT